MKRMVLAGGSGFLGGALVKNFRAHGWDITVLTRSPRERSDGAKDIFWDGKSSGDWEKFVDGAEVVVNLTGKTVDCRYHAKNRQEILASRVDSTRVMGEAIARATQPPRVWLNSSSATLYLHTFGTPMDENGETGATPAAKDKFSVEVIRQWERALDAAQTPHTRKVALRAAMVLGRARNSVFLVLQRLTRYGLGGRMGSGRQYVSWIHQEDFCRVIEWLIARDDLSGVVNLCAPNPLPNAEMMRLFRKICGVRFGPPAPEWLLELGAFFIRTETELIIKSRRVIPARLLASGFQFNFSKMEDALKDLTNKT